MRSRYSAFVRKDVDYLVQTHEHPEPQRLRQELTAGIDCQHWLKLTIVATEQGDERDTLGFVSFVATYIDGGVIGELLERSKFRRRKGCWRYVGAVPE
jgi:SEC-C motif-containing protein